MERYESLRAKEKLYAQSQRSTRVPRRPLHARGQRREGNQAMPPACSTAHIWPFDSEDFWRCIELSREAVDLAPDCAAYYNLLGLALAKNPKWRQDAEKPEI